MPWSGKSHANWIARNARNEAMRLLRLENLERFEELYQAERRRLQIVTGYEDGRSTLERRQAAAEAAEASGNLVRRVKKSQP